MVNVKKLFDLTGRVALVTGGSMGFGKEIAIGLGEAGARVVIVARHEEELNATRDEIRGMGIECVALKGDVRKPEEVKAFVAETVNRWDKIDILINNAGVGWATPAIEYPLSQWERIMATNITGVMICSQEAARQMMKQNSGVIVNMASATGIVGVDARIMISIPYHASKGAVIALTKQLAIEWAPYNIRVNALAPFFFPTRMSKMILDKSTSELNDIIPMHRLGRPGEIKGAALFLASDASSYVTGHTLVIDGGHIAW